MPNAYADGFGSPIMKLSRNPTICAFEPPLDPQFPGIGSKLLTQTNNAVLEWQQKLNEGYGKHPAWNMHLIQVLLNQQSSFDLTQCDITVYYKREPDNPDAKFVEAGVTYPDTFSHKAKIEIYYLGANVKWDVNDYQVSNGILYVYTPKLYYTGYLAPDPQLQNTIDHELGHSFGLAHYIIPNDILYKITQEGQLDPPSIMIPVVVGYGVTNFNITPADVAEMKSIYGYNGFAPQQPTVDYSTSLQGSPPTSYEIHTDKASYLVGEKGTISGYLYTFNGATTGTVYVFDPGVNIVDQFPVSSQDSKWFSIPFDTAKYPITGKYMISLKVGQAGGTIAKTTFDLTRPTSIPPWIKNTAKWWSNGTVSDSEFTSAIQYLIQQGILQVPNSHSGSVTTQAIPTWVKTNAGWWANGGISDDEFVRGIQYLISAGMIQPYS